jgi:hypothetical protein
MLICSGSWIPDPISNNNKKETVKNFDVLPFFGHKFHIIKSYFISEQVIKKFEPVEKEFKYFLGVQ